jgi:hypothetical protein
MVFEGSDGALSSIATVNMGRGQLNIYGLVSHELE